jgi:hypothetical protein
MAQPRADTSAKAQKTTDLLMAEPPAKHGKEKRDATTGDTLPSLLKHFSCPSGRDGAI